MALSAALRTAAAALLGVCVAVAVPRSGTAGDPAAPTSPSEVVWPLALLDRRAPATLEAWLPGPDVGEHGYLVVPRAGEGEDAEEDEERPPSAPPLLVERLQASEARVLRSGGSLVLVGALTGEERGDVEALLAAAGVAVRLRVEVESPWGGGALSTVVRPGRTARLGGSWRSPEVRSYRPELACDNSGGLRPSALGKPVVAWTGDGWGADVRPFLVPGSDAVALEVLITAGARVGPSARLAAAPVILGQLELPTADLALLTGSGRVGPGEALVLEGQLEGARVSARVTAEVLGERPDPRPKARLVRLPTDLLLAPPWTADFADDSPGYDDLNSDPPLALSITHVLGPAPLTPAALAQAIVGGSPVAADAERGGTDLLGEPREVREALQRLNALAQPYARTARLRVSLRAAGAPVGGLTLSALAGRGSVVRLGRARSVLLDHDTEVG